MPAPCDRRTQSMAAHSLAAQHAGHAARRCASARGTTSAFWSWSWAWKRQQRAAQVCSANAARKRGALAQQPLRRTGSSLPFEDGSLSTTALHDVVSARASSSASNGAMPPPSPAAASTSACFPANRPAAASLGATRTATLRHDTRITADAETELAVLRSWAPFIRTHLVGASLHLWLCVASNERSRFQCLR